MMSTEFLDAVRQGKNEWWRYVLSFMLIVFFWAFLGSLPWLMLGMDLPLDAVGSAVSGRDQLLQYVLISLSFCCFGMGIFLAIKYIHHRRFNSLIHSTSTVRWKRVAQGFIVWLALTAITYSLEVLSNPNRFSFTFKPVLWLIFLPLALVLTPIQAATEELFFRGYLLQGFSLLTKNRWLLISLSTGIFGWLHLGNPEVTASAQVLWLGALYFTFGAFLALITLQDQSLELAIGQHAANNLFLALIVRDKVSVLDTPAIVTRIVTPDARVEFFLFLLQATAFYYIVFRSRAVRHDKDMPT